MLNSETQTHSFFARIALLCFLSKSTQTLNSFDGNVLITTDEVYFLKLSN